MGLQSTIKRKVLESDLVSPHTVINPLTLLVIASIVRHCITKGDVTIRLLIDTIRESNIWHVGNLANKLND